SELLHAYCFTYSKVVAILLVVDSLILLMFFCKCIALEADLMCELLRHGAKPTDDIIEQSSGIRLCALSLLSIKVDQSVFAAAAAMVGIAKEAKTICDWVKKEKKLVKFSSSTHYELEWRFFYTYQFIGCYDNHSAEVFLSFQGQWKTEYILLGILIEQMMLCNICAELKIFWLTKDL
ncbi:hypothetical protein EJB05_30250, partial [Eragrostis curvula]